MTCCPGVPPLRRAERWVRSRSWGDQRPDGFPGGFVGGVPVPLVADRVDQQQPPGCPRGVCGAGGLRGCVLGWLAAGQWPSPLGGSLRTKVVLRNWVTACAA